MIEDQITTLRPYNARYTGDHRSFFRKRYAEMITRISLDMRGRLLIWLYLAVTPCNSSNGRDIGETGRLRGMPRSRCSQEGPKLSA